jgi:hypothetical protein
MFEAYFLFQKIFYPYFLNEIYIYSCGGLEILEVRPCCSRKRKKKRKSLKKKSGESSVKG